MVKSGYTKFIERINRFPQGAPPSEKLYQILSILLSSAISPLRSATTFSDEGVLI